MISEPRGRSPHTFAALVLISPRGRIREPDGQHFVGDRLPGVRMDRQGGDAGCGAVPPVPRRRERLAAFCILPALASHAGLFPDRSSVVSRMAAAPLCRLPVVFKAVDERLTEVTEEQKPDLPANLKQAATLIQNLGRFASLSGNDAELLSDYDATIDLLAQDIDGSCAHVHLLYYIFADDETGQKIIAALGRAVSRGVPCRVLIDALGSRPWATRTVAALRAAGVEVHLVLPLGILRRKSARADLRNHRKIAVIDGKVGYVGSQNLVDRDFKGGIVNQELVVGTTGPVVLELQGVFVTDWFLETEQVLDDPAICPEPHYTGEMIAQVLPSGPDHPGAGVERLIEALIYGARTRVVITTPYFIPNEALLHALETAVLRGCRRSSGPVETSRSGSGEPRAALLLRCASGVGGEHPPLSGQACSTPST